MSTYDDEERTERTLFSLSYRGTAKEARTLYLSLLGPEWERWSRLDDYCKAIRIPSSDGHTKDTKDIGSDLPGWTVFHCQTEAYRAMVELCARRIEEMGL